MSALRVATANAASGRDHRGRCGRAEWTSWATAAAALDVDVLAVQEVDHLLPRSEGVDQTGVLAGVLARAGGRLQRGAAWEARFAAAVQGTPGSVGSFRPAVATDLAEPSYGVALLSRHPVSAWAELRLAPSRARLPVRLPAGAGRRVLWVPDEPRVALAAVVEAPDGPVTVVTTHLSFAPWAARRQLREVLRWSAALPDPHVLLGDLNLPRRLVGRLVGRLAAGWTPAAYLATYPADRPRVQLDHVLLGEAVTGLGAASTHQVADSDHLAVRVLLSLGPQQPQDSPRGFQW